MIAAFPATSVGLTRRHLTHHWPGAIAALAALLSVVMLACGPASNPADAATPTPSGEIATEDPSPTPTASEVDMMEGDLELVIYNTRTQESTGVQEVSELQAELPFDIVVPEYLPEGLRLAGVTAHVGGPGIRGDTADLFFQSTDERGGLALNQAPFTEGMGPPGISGDNVEEVAIGDGTGELQEVDEPDRPHFISMVWAGCDVAFSLVAPGEYGREELLRVAESTLACQGLG